MTKIVRVFVAAAVFFTALSCVDPALKLPDYGPVPPFHMTDSEGHPFDSKRLLGSPWIVDFIYTTCPGPCPRMTSQMHKAAEQLHADPSIRIVSISVDPDTDTPAVLNEYAHRFGAPTPQWTFLTGSPATVHLLAHDTFKVGDVIANMTHSTKFMLVDKKGELRGYYSSLAVDGLPDDIPALVRDARILSRQRS